jgi:hypothetical protein
VQRWDRSDSRRVRSQAIVDVGLLPPTNSNRFPLPKEREALGALLFGSSPGVSPTFQAARTLA